MAKQKIVTTADQQQRRMEELFFSAATQYYVSGRYAFLAGLIPVAGNLLHHAIEMYLKGVLCKTMTLGELKELSHDLPKIWTAVKSQITDSGLASFDTLIVSLGAFEELRYPDSVSKKGAAIRFGVDRPTNTKVTTAGRPVPIYELFLAEVDALVDKTFHVASVNPDFFVASLSTKAREYLKEANVQRWAAG